MTTATRRSRATLIASAGDDGAGSEPAGSDPERPRRFRDALLAALGVLGALTLLWLAVSSILSLSVIVFVTGSMSPTMPTGAAAVVQRVAAAELTVGDVVTVLKEDGVTPVTHRIVEIDDVEGRPSARELTLRGDANSFVDSARYIVEEAPRVLVSTPNAGWVIIWAKSPLVSIALAVGLAAAIAWALWPSASRHPRGDPDAAVVRD
ncbi:signal peptidase I [Microbacterium sp. RG1]|uniref:signal peptidase I n=1 Tax=Microbacterium sp. RG1 TaxID=2489212 RepID=UPI0010CA4582|nr:signal peptidase I [Microbacterium sp. RG1]QCQ15613.1 signal peptidase I [Microbacterium sp. RG1]